MIKLLLLLPVMILLANLVFLDYMFLNPPVKTTQTNSDYTSLIERINRLELKVLELKTLNSSLSTGSARIENPTVNACPVSCINLIDNSLTSLKQPTPTAGVTQSSTTIASQKGEFYVPLGSGSVSELNTWATLGSAQAIIDPANYTNIKQAYFEAIMRTDSGEVKARLYDSTTPFIYAGNEARTDSSVSQLVSVPITLRPGAKTYKVQLYSTIATGVLESARIKIVTQ